MTHIPRAFCAHCDLEMFPDEIGKMVETTTQGRPYYKVSVDKWKCRSCGTLVLLHDKNTQIIHHSDSRYNEYRADYRIAFK